MYSNNSSGKSKTLVKLAQRLQLNKPNHNLIQPSNQEDYANRAAVLIALFEGENGEIRVILTRRSSTMSSHSGEVALPGGRWEKDDENDASTALREAKEEIGLDPSIVEVVAILEPFQTKRNIVVYPVIGIIWNKNDINLVPNAAEVESIFDPPLEMFLKDENRREEEKEWLGDRYLLHFFDYEAENKSYIIWALSAGILIKTASVVYDRPPDFDERRPKFWLMRQPQI